MKSNHFLQLIIFCLAFFCASASQAVPVSDTLARAWVEDKGNQLLSTFNEPDLAKKYQKLDSLFSNHVDLDYIGKFVVGKYWRTMTQEQQQKYLKLFNRYALAVYKGFPLSFQNKISFQVNNVSSTAEYTDVWTVIKIADVKEGNPDTAITVAFRLHQIGKQPKIVDIKLAESSLILSYRTRFYQMIVNNDGDIEWFLEDLETSTVSTEKNNRLKLDEAEPVDVKNLNFKIN